MDVVIYQSFLIYIFVLFYGVHTISVVIKGSDVGLIGENGTEIECSYTLDNILQIFSVSFKAFNRNSNMFETVVTYIPDQPPLLNTQGEYLKGRVTLTPITQLSTKAVMTFNMLMGIDDTLYSCQVNYLDSIDTHAQISNNISIVVQADTSTLPSSSTGSSSDTDEKSGNPTKDRTPVIIAAPVIIGVSVGVIFVVLLILAFYLYKRKKKGKDESAENNGSTDNLMHCNSKYVGESRPGAYDSVALEGDDPVIYSGKKEQNVEDVRKHNEEYMKKQKNEEKIENKSPTSHQPVIYAAVNEATKSKYRQTIETQDSSNQQEDDTYAGTQEGVYDQSGDRRHKVNENAEQFDTVGDIKKRNSTDGIESTIQSSQKGSYVNQAFNKGEKRQVATVPPISRSSGGSQGDEQTSEINAKRSQKGYENVKGTDNTHTSDALTINQTSL